MSKPQATLIHLSRHVLLPGIVAWALFSATHMPLLAQDQSDSFRGYSLSHVKADDAAARMQTLLSDLGAGVQVLVDRTQNRILISGDEKSTQLVAQFLQTIDQPEIARSVPNHELNQVIGYRVGTEPLETVVARLRKQYPPASGVRVATDTRTQQVIVVAPPSVQREIAQQLSQSAPVRQSVTAAPQVATAAAPTPVPTPSYELKNSTWRELEDGLRRVWRDDLSIRADGSGEVATALIGSRPVMQIDRRRNAVSFPGTVETSGPWRQVVAALDYPHGQADRKTQLISLKNAEANQVQTAVSLLRGAARQVRSTHQTEPRWGGRLVSMIFQEAGQPQAAGGQGPFDTGQDAPEPAAGESEGTGLIGDVQIEILEPLGVIVIRGHPRDVQRIERIIQEIEDIAQETRPVTEVYYLEHVNGQAVATLITELYEEAFEPRQGPISIRALFDPNAILLVGSIHAVDSAKELISKLDQPMDPASRFIIMRLKHISAVDAEQTVRNFFVTTPGTATDPRPGLGTQVRIIADYRSNSLIVQASPRDLAEAQKLVESIDVSGDDVDLISAEIKVFRLRNALSDDLALVLQSAIIGQSTTGGAQPGQAAGAAGAAPTQATLPSAQLELMVIDQESKQRLRSGILSGASVTSNPSINALIVRAPSDSMELIAELIKQLDQLPDAEAQLKVFMIVNGDATNLATMLQQLFGQEATIGQGNAQFAFGGLGQQQQLQNITAGGDTSLVPLRFAVDVRTNSIMASGSEGDLIVVETLLARLDEGDIETRTLTVVRLKNAPAQDVALSITTFLNSQRDLIQQDLLFNQAVSPFEQIERHVVVVPELVTNSLIVSATPRYHDVIMQVIRDLDFRPAMVMVQVLIAEVSLDDVFQFGVELGLQDSLLFDRGIASAGTGVMSNPGFNFNNVGLPNLSDASRNNVAGQSISSFGVGRTSSALGYGGLVLSAASDSVSVLVRALQDAGRLQVLSRPQIMTLNNQPAFVQVGADVSRITGTTITTGIVQNNVVDVQTGLILNITPLINDDGIVVMNLGIERSRLGDAQDGTVVAVSENGTPIFSPPIERTTAQTTISAKSGQTVVFAGLITKDKALNLRRVPWLSDLPGVGWLFEFETTIERRTELLIVMTPYIISSDEDYEFIKAIESQRMSYCLADAVEVHGEVGLQGGGDIFCCEGAPLIFPHLDPTGMDYLSREPGPAIDGPQLAPLYQTNGNSQLAPVAEGSGIVPPARLQPRGQLMYPQEESSRRVGYLPAAGDVQRANYAVGQNGAVRQNGPTSVQPLQRLPNTRP